MIPPASEYKLSPYTTLFRSWWSSVRSISARRYVCQLMLPFSERGRPAADLTYTPRVSIDLTVQQQLDRLDDAHARSVSEIRSEEHTSELQSRFDLVCRLLLE